MSLKPRSTLSLSKPTVREVGVSKGLLGQIGDRFFVFEPLSVERLQHFRLVFWRDHDDDRLVSLGA